MGFFYKHLIHPLLSKYAGKYAGKKVFTNNPYLGFIIEASDSDVIADEQFHVGLAYYLGAYMLPKDIDKALSYFKKAAERGHAVAQMYMSMGCMKFDDDHSEEVMYWLQKAAEQGERRALYNLGISYHRGDIGGVPDISKSNELFRQSAENDYIPAFYRMAYIYLYGKGVEKNLAIAKYWAYLDFLYHQEKAYEESILYLLIKPDDIDENNTIKRMKILEDAVVAGERDAMHRWAIELNETGEEEKAIELWEKAARLKHPLGMCNLARYYLTDEVKDYEQARALFEEASKSGCEHAFYGLALIYLFGYGVEKDVEKAWAYLEKALNKGNTEARELYFVMCWNNDLQTILPGNILRGMNFWELAWVYPYPQKV